MTEQIAQQEAPQVEPTSTETAKTGGKTYTEAELENILKERLGREKAKADKQAQAAAEKAAAEAAAKNGEWEKLAKQREEELAKVLGEIKARDLADRKRAIGEKVGLPAALATRLQGDTDEDLEKDAKALLETLPKQPKPNPGPTNPGGTATTTETLAQKKERLLGTRSSNPLAGGGVVWGDRKPE